MNARTERLRRIAAIEGPRIALVSLYDVENNAVRLLAALLRREGFHAVEIYFKDWISNYLEPPSERELEDFLRVLRRERVNLVGLSVRASAYENQARILSRLVQERLRIPVLWGGTHVTLSPESCFPEADLLVRGEGEGPLVELAQRLRDGRPLDDIQNLAYLRDGRPVLNPLRPLISDLDALPFRDYSTDEHKYFVHHGAVSHRDPMRGDPVFQMMGSRGCIYHCSYCYNSTIKKRIYPGQRWYRTRSLDSVLAEIREARRQWPFKRIRFDDEVFNFKRDWFDAFCERYPREVGLPFEIFIEPKLVTRDRIHRLRQAGLEGVYMGIQSSERITDTLYDRHVKDDSLVQIARIFSEERVFPHYQLIFDDPISTADDMRHLFELVASFPRPFDLYLFSLTVFPNTELERELLEAGIIDPYDVEGRNTRTFYQHRVNLAYPRPVQDTYWISLIQLLSKRFLPRSLLRSLTRSRFLREHPWPLIQFAHGANYVKIGSTAALMALRGEMTATLLRRWLSFSRVITT